MTHLNEIAQAQARNQEKTVSRQGASFLTGYCDASYHPPTELGGWGLWIRGSHSRVLRSGPCPDWVRNSNEAELSAVFATVYTAITHFDTSQADVLLIKTDSQHTAKLFGWGGGLRPRRRRPEVEDLVLRAYLLIEETPLKLLVTWVKGHREAADTSAYLNSHVDRMARVAREKRTCWKRVIPIGENR